MTERLLLTLNQKQTAPTIPTATPSWHMWDTDEVCEFLVREGHPDVEPLFRHNQVKGKVLRCVYPWWNSWKWLWKKLSCLKTKLDSNLCILWAGSNHPLWQSSVYSLRWYWGNTRHVRALLDPMQGCISNLLPLITPCSTHRHSVS